MTSEFPIDEPYSEERELDAYLAEVAAEDEAELLANLRNEASGPDTTKAREARFRLAELEERSEWDQPIERF